MPIDEKVLQGLQENTLRTLDLSQQNLTDSDIKPLAEALIKNTRLKELRLNKNKLSEKGARLLWEALKRNDTLWSLDLSENQAGFLSKKITESTLQKISWKLQLNKGRRIWDERGCLADIRDRSVTKLDLECPFLLFFRNAN